jgi:DNA-binding CsgD family transcriptional regulator
MLVGRATETAAIDRLLAGAREGQSGVLVLRGEAGIGKSSLLEYAREHATGFTVLRGTGIESESELAYAALHQILRPVLDRIDKLPDPQAAALRGAFALSTETVDDRFRVSLGTLSLLAEASDEQPVLCLIDDAQWLDRSSADALVFVARRLQAESLVLLFSARDDDSRAFEARGLPELRLSSLNAQDSRSLLQDRLGSNTAAGVFEWLVDNADGNPLALVELPEALTSRQLEGRDALAGKLPPTTSVEQAYLERMSRLPVAARSMLLLASAEETGDRATITRAADELGLDPAALAAGEAEGLIRVAPHLIEFRHPLVRSAIYRAAGFTERELVHRALATALDSEGDADRRAWHRAAAAVGTEDDVAAELEATAGRAERRAGHGAASAALERAAELTADEAEQGRRLVLAAVAANLAGRTARAITIADRAEQIVQDPIQRADLAHVRGDAELLSGRPEHASDVFASGSEAVAAHDSRRALELAGASIRAAALCGDSARVGRGLQQANSIKPDPDDDEQVLMSAINRGIESIQRGDLAAGGPVLRDVLTRSLESDHPRVITLGAVAATFLGDHEQASHLHGRIAAGARRTGALSLLVNALGSQAAASFLARKLPEATAQADEAARLARDLGLENPAAQPLALLAWIAALHGEEDACRQHAAEALQLAAARGLALAAATATWALAELDLGAGRWEEALRGLEAVGEVRRGFSHPLLSLISTPDRVEAAVRAGRADSAKTAFAAFETWAESSNVPWARPVVERCRGLMAPSEEASRHFEEALRLHEEDENSFDRARTELLFGELLRRDKQRTEARRHLHAALTTFEQFNAAFWAERAGNELRATGETARRRDPSTLAQLTPQELQIATLVAEGGSNKEIAAQLFLSPRTVEYHLRKVFQKLGISSRTELIRHGVAQEGVVTEEVVALR